MSSAEQSARGRRTGVRRVKIDTDSAGQRIDNFLRRQLPGVPRSRIYRVLRKGEVRVNGGRVGADYRLAPGDEVRIPPANVRAPAEPPATGQSRQMLDSIIYEDKRLLVVDKPGGVAVHGGSGIRHGVIERLRAARPDLRDLALAHRLDRETSGCLVLAKKRSALRELHEQFRAGKVEKNYLALVGGDWQLGEYLIDVPLLTQHRRNGERHVVVSGGGKNARTTVRLSRAYRGFSLLQCQPATGRTHQLRVHLVHVGHPIAGDERYGASEQNKALQKKGLKRLFLHAQSIAFPDGNGNEMHFTAPLAADLQRVLDRIDGRNRA